MRYNVTLPAFSQVECEIEADSEEDAIKIALGLSWSPREAQNFHVVRDMEDVKYALVAETEELDEEDDDPDDEYEDDE